jgi:hypothetical protein
LGKKRGYILLGRVDGRVGKNQNRLKMLISPRNFKKSPRNIAKRKANGFFCSNPSGEIIPKS